MSKRLLALLGVGLLAGIVLVLALRNRHSAERPDLPPRGQVQAFLDHPESLPQAGALLAELRESLDRYRKIIVLFADDTVLKPEERLPVDQVGRALYYENLDQAAFLERALAAIVGSRRAERFQLLEEVLGWIESSPDLYDADRLTFRETLRVLERAVSRDQSLPAVRFHRRLAEDLAALDEIESLYDKELKQVFGRFAERGITFRRQRWDDYLTRLKGMTSREAILRDYGIIVPYPPKAPLPDDSREITGTKLPSRTLLFTFDDGPHRVYTGEIAAILKQYGLSGVFFEVGQSLGSIGADGQPKLGPLAGTSRQLVQDGFTLGNHSYGHTNFAKQSDAVLKDEIARTSTLLGAIRGSDSGLFRFPYGARTESGLQVLEDLRLKSVLWNIDSLDWADPIPNSIADRVFRSIDTAQRGILLFHDINERTTKALPGILDRLIAEGYSFASWDGTGFKVGDANLPASAKAVPTTGYRESWGVIIGIDDYSKWPKLRYAVQDAEAVRQDLVGRFGFAEDHVFLLKNQEATRSAILDLVYRKLGPEGVQRDDRVFVFFAGHGTTRKLTSGRDLGYIVPVDADPQNVASDAIPMTELQNLAEAIPAKHVLFVMDSCYSGLGLMRGGAPQNFLKENARRVGRQMLTAGGADQLVSDGGPGGHSIFTWTLLQGLAGKADLNGDGYITSTELAAYVAPAVASVSTQTPAFGSLPGSEGGEFVFELPVQSEFLNTETPQMEGQAIALTQKQAAQPDAPVTVKNLDGGETTLAAAKAVPLAPRQAAQRANDRGLLLYREKRYAEAEAEFAEALKLRPDFALAANNLGFVFYKQAKYVEAARWFENAIRMDPSRAIAYCNLGDAYLKAGEKSKARRAFETYLELAPKAPSAEHARRMLESLSSPDTLN